MIHSSPIPPFFLLLFPPLVPLISLRYICFLTKLFSTSFTPCQEMLFNLLLIMSCSSSSFICYFMLSVYSPSPLSSSSASSDSYSSSSYTQSRTREWNYNALTKSWIDGISLPPPSSDAPASISTRSPFTTPSQTGIGKGEGKREPDESGTYLYFSPDDGWEKRRSQRRIFYDEFLVL